jgi:glycerophosphoryl diester phosphodiesterase
MRPRPLLLGHRGVRGRDYRVRENTIAAFDLALEHGCDGFEFDVRLAADGRAVVCHNARSAGINILKASSEKLRRLPLLEDVVIRYAERAFLDIELKVPGLESCLLSLLANYVPQRGYVVSSFLPKLLIDLRARHESMPLGLICETRQELRRWPELPIQYVIAKQSLITPKLIADLHSASKDLFAWTVNRRELMLRLRDWGVDGIISDKPDLLVAALRADRHPKAKRL